MNEAVPKPVERLTRQTYFQDPSLPLQVYIRDPQPVFPLHGHSFDELVIILKGTAVHAIDNQQFPVRRGDTFVVTHDRVHEYRDMKNLALANILFDAEALMMDQWDIRSLPGFHALFALEPAFRVQHRFQSRLQLSEVQLAEADRLIRRLEAETTSRTPGYRVAARGLFMELAVLLSRAYSSTPTEETMDLLRIGDAIAHIEAHYADPINLDELAVKSRLSRRHFQRIFRECIGRSPIDHLIRVRVRKAAELLKYTDRTITDIAFECGFSDGNYFTRCFRKVMAKPSPRHPKPPATRQKNCPFWCPNKLKRWKTCTTT